MTLKEAVDHYQECHRRVIQAKCALEDAKRERQRAWATLIAWQAPMDEPLETEEKSIA